MYPNGGRETCSPASKGYRSLDLWGIRKQRRRAAREAWLSGEDMPAHVIWYPGFVSKKCTLRTTVLKQISLLGGDNVFYSQPFLFKRWLKPASTMNHWQKFCFLHTRKLRWKEKPSVSHFYSLSLAAKHLQSKSETESPKWSPRMFPVLWKGSILAAPKSGRKETTAISLSILLWCWDILRDSQHEPH